MAAALNAPRILLALPMVLVPLAAVVELGAPAHIVLALAWLAAVPVGLAGSAAPASPSRDR